MKALLPTSVHSGFHALSIRFVRTVAGQQEFYFELNIQKRLEELYKIIQI